MKNLNKTDLFQEIKKAQIQYGISLGQVLKEKQKYLSSIDQYLDLV